MSIISFNQFQSKYRFECQLSQGSFGRVCRIQEIQTKKYFALKKVMVKKKQQLEDIENQIRLLNRFKHPFIVQIRETYNIQIKNGYAKPIWEIGIVMELAKCSLEQMIRMKKCVGSFQFILEQTIGLIRILFILQQQNIAHRDIKPANILVFQGADNSYRWKLADFGLALDLSRNKQQDNFAGSFQYASPKLKRKFKYPNLKIKTNSFKDDVFSLGVTLLQTITGLRIYNTVAFEKLREVCDQKKLINLVDIMLQQDQEKRPCFKQLMILIEKDFKHYILDVETQNLKQMNKMPKKISSHEDRYQQMTDKTVVRKYDKQIKKTIINTGKPIQCVTNIDGIIMCGCETGEIIFVRDCQIINTGQIHVRNVSQFFVDEKENIWSIGGDGHIKIWFKRQLVEALKNDVKQVTTYKNKLFKTQPITSLILQVNESVCQDIKFPFQQSIGASCFFGDDQNNFAVGFYDGRVYIRWRGNEYNFKLFTKSVQTIKLSRNGTRFWLCSLDGQVKCIETKQLAPTNRFFFKKEAQFIQLFLNEQGQEEFASLLTLDGKQIILNQDLQCVFENTLIKNRVMSAVKTDKNCFMLSDTGQITDSNEQKIIQLHSKGWNCLSLLSDQQLIAGSFTGELAWISW